MSSKKSDLVPRVITAVVAVPLLLALVLYGPAWAFFVLVAVAAAISAWEYCQMTFGAEHPGARGLTVVLSPVLTATMYYARDWFVDVLAGSVLALFLYLLFFYRDQGRVTHVLGSAVAGLLYSSVLFGTLALLHQAAGEAGALWVLLVMAVVWSSDTGAYFTGRALGKRKLYPAVSPNKSVEGAVGGLVSSVVAAVALNELYAAQSAHWHHLEWWMVLALAVPANLLGQTGDLAESLVKRAHGVKDSGTIIYGHGGMLDRIDALIFAAPWFYFVHARLLPLWLAA